MKVSKASSAIFLLTIISFSVATLTGCDSNTNSAAASNKPMWFAKLDKDGDGKISTEEIKAVDKNGDGKISLDEAKDHGMPEVDFKKLDKDGDGGLTLEEMRTYGG
jgi:Ca2+-binding EF-hand superfamily protein